MVNVAKYTLEGSSIKDNDKEILTKADGITIKDKIDGKDVDVISIKNASGKGKIEFSKDKDGKGTGTISGLADPTQDDHATNKHYVDSKIKELIDNSIY